MTKRQKDKENTLTFLKSKKEFDKSANAEITVSQIQKKEAEKVEWATFLETITTPTAESGVPGQVKVSNLIWGFDIETLPADDCDLFAPEVYDIDSRLKDPDKINEAYKKAEKKWWDSTSLHPLTGKVAMVSIVRYDIFQDTFDYEEVFHIKEVNSEKAILQRTFERFDSIMKNWQTVVGHNIFEFDLPFLIRRAWKNEIGVPTRLTDRYSMRDCFKDTSQMFTAGIWKDKFVSLNNLLKFFGLPTKQYSGKDFADLYRNNPEEAVRYCVDDSKNAIRVYLAMTNRTPSKRGDQ